jgi:hypothetical protein
VGFPFQTLRAALPQAAKPIGGYSLTPMKPWSWIARMTRRSDSPTPSLPSDIVSRNGQNGAKPWTRPPVSAEMRPMTSTWSPSRVAVGAPRASHQS